MGYHDSPYTTSYRLTRARASGSGVRGHHWRVLWCEAFQLAFAGSSIGLGYRNSGPSSRVSRGSRRVESVSSVRPASSSSLPTVTTTEIPEITATSLSSLRSTSISATTTSLNEEKRASGASRVLVWEPVGGRASTEVSRSRRLHLHRPPYRRLPSLFTPPSSTSTLATTPSIALLLPSFLDSDLV